MTSPADAPRDITAPAAARPPDVPARPPSSSSRHADAALAAMPLPALLESVGTYVSRFEASMSSVVLEERYVQLLKRSMTPPTSPDDERLAWREGKNALDVDAIAFRRRQTRSDVLLVQLPNQTWTVFRDVVEADGRVLGKREDRLRKLFLEGTSDSRKQLRRINEASAKWNLGRFYREINLPTLGLMILQPGRQRGFSFTLGGVEQAGAVVCRSVSFVETQRPTLVRTSRQRDVHDVPLRGSFCADADGRVWRTRFDLDERYTARGVILVTFAAAERLDVLVPERMWEWYVFPGYAGFRPYIEALATYSNLRRFTVETIETVR